jgi:hypothetical protein
MGLARRGGGAIESVQHVYSAREDCARA